MRLFIAICFPDEIKNALYRETITLRDNAVCGSFSRKENLHLTLAFLGELHQSRVKDIRMIMAALPKVSLSLEIANFGWFSSRGERLYWRGLTENAKLVALQKDLCAMLRTADFTLDEKPFHPHITLARRCVLVPEFDLKTFQAHLPIHQFPVQGVSLMRSERIGGRLIYTEMYRTNLS
jgi:2'-5' RNA ligase